MIAEMIGYEPPTTEERERLREREQRRLKEERRQIAALQRRAAWERRYRINAEREERKRRKWAG
jgi:hypothetical protein